VGSAVKVGGACVGVTCPARAVIVICAATSGSTVGSSVGTLLGRLHACRRNRNMITRYKSVFFLFMGHPFCVVDLLQKSI